MKVYIHYEDTEDESRHTTLKIKFFVGHYNKKFPDETLDADKVGMKRKGGIKVAADDAIVSEVFQEYDDIYVVHIDETKDDAEASTKDSAVDKNLVRCKNYGCKMMFDPSKNGPTSCRHHVAPPIFHDTKKGWSCCKHRMVYDWSEFEQIEGCTVGPHSTVDPKIKFAASPTVAVAKKAIERSGAEIKSIDQYNKENPDAVSAASSARKTVAAARSRGPITDSEGRFKCVRKGCGNFYCADDNTDTACTYHPGNAVFHDTKKYYSCCDHRVAYDFDDFLKIEGCTKGPHACRIAT
eukprot:g2333.t1